MNKNIIMVKAAIICLVNLLFYTIVVSTANAQFLSNPSMEGPTGFSVIPSGWSVCDGMSTPDTEPGAENTNITYAPSNGISYVALVLRGTVSPYAYHPEDIMTHLLKPLIKDKCYRLKIDLACSNEYGHDSWDYGWISYINPAGFKIFGGNTSCERTELFVQLDSVDNRSWKTFEFIIHPVITDINYMILQTVYCRPNIYFGNILIDNLSLEEIPTYDITKLDTTIHFGESLTFNASNANQYVWSPDIGLSCNDCQNPIVNPPYSITYTASLIGENVCESHKELFEIEVIPVIPNIITPNGDGKNDVFEIAGLETGTSLKITDRWGTIVYETDNYDNTWDGKFKSALLEPDTYWYVLKFPSIKKAVTGYVYLKL